VFLSGAVAAVLIAVFGIHVASELKLRWVCQQVRQEILQVSEVSRDAPLSILRPFLGTNETSYAVYARLLLDNDPHIWTSIVSEVGWNMGAKREVPGGPLAPLEVYLRDHEPVAWVKYLLPEAFRSGTDWRAEGSLPFPDYWSGRKGLPLAPDPAVIDFLRRFLAEEKKPTAERSFSVIPFRDQARLGLEIRAVYALRAMLLTSPPPSEAIEILRSTATEHAFLPVQVAALSALCRMQNPFDEDPPCIAEPPWLLRAPSSLVNCLYRDLLSEAVPQEPSHIHHHFELLAHFDSAWAMWILVHLRQKPGLESVVDGALRLERGRWPVPKPKWLPLEAAGERYLTRSSFDERATAMLALVALGTPAARRVLAAHEKREVDAELQFLARCGLAALGDARLLAAVEPEVLRRLPAPAQGWLPFDGPWPKENYGWAKPSRADSTELTRLLLLAGSFATLDRVVKIFLESGWWLPMDLTRLVESCPLTPWSELPTDPDVITFGYQQAKEAELRSFASWWQEHACQLEWNESRRIFTLRKDAAVR